MFGWRKRIDLADRDGGSALRVLQICACRRWSRRRHPRRRRLDCRSAAIRSLAEEKRTLRGYRKSVVPDRGCVKTPNLNLRIESSSQFCQLEKKHAGEHRRAKTIKKTILRLPRARTFSHSLDPKRTLSGSTCCAAMKPLPVHYCYPLRCFVLGLGQDDEAAFKVGRQNR